MDEKNNPCKLAMTVKKSQLNASVLNDEIQWFSLVLDVRISLYFQSSCEYEYIEDVLPPELDNDPSEYAHIVKTNQMGFRERIIFILAMIPYVRPQILDTLFIRNKTLDRNYTEFGGWKGNTHSGFLPTLETVVFILSGNDLQKRFEILSLFSDDHYFFQLDILRLECNSINEPMFSSALILSPEYMFRCTTGVTKKPDFNSYFPAKLITTHYQWKDLVLAPKVTKELDVVKTWIHNSDVIMKDWGLEKTLKPGYRCLFYGPPGTGKTLTATLMGAEIGADVYRIDLSMIVSKYIGETEKNLANVFDQAKNRNWILFFDEADALFGKRTQTSSSNDRYANQEVSYLLQRVEDHPGVVILATNLKANIDDAFARRFQSLIYFPLPNADQRKQLWENTLSGKIPLKKDLDLGQIAENYELSGGAISNVVRHAAVNALQMKRNVIKYDDLLEGVMKEMRKEGKTI